MPSLRSCCSRARGAARPRAGVDRDEPLVDWVRLEGGVNVGSGFDLDRFYKILLEKHGAYVGPGHWFDGKLLPPRPDGRARTRVQGHRCPVRRAARDTVQDCSFLRLANFGNALLFAVSTTFVRASRTSSDSFRG